MNFLDNLVLPQSGEHLQLLNYLLALSLFVLIPYLSILLGFSYLSSKFYKLGIKENKDEYIKVAKIIIDSVTFNKVMVLGFGLIPLLTSGLIIIQVLYLRDLHLEYYFYISIISFLIAAIFIYSFKHSLSIYLVTKRILKDDSDINEIKIVKDYSTKTQLMNKKYPTWSFVFLLISTYFLIAALQLSSNNLIWQKVGFFDVLFSLNTVFYFLSFVALTILLSYSIFLYLLKKNEDIILREYFIKLNKFGITGNIISVITYIIIISLKVVFTPLTGLSTDYFILLIFTLAILLVIAINLYRMLKESKFESINSIIFLSILIVLLGVVQNTSAFSVSTNKEIQIISEKYLVYQDEFKQSLGITTVIINGEDIYKGKCVACHAFDKKIVGPPYNEVLKKYEGKIDDLAKFILNPIKINPDYPAMPNQGVKPAEARAVAEYILTTYSK
ncbi:MAG TPA: c-type cytochrome [Melioribacteraceae bacterium]|nr:c-type cytochrome [Melioribacteraceae bacterium]